ncbi:O-antigen/teichoic acid export membrane protein [Pseudonocardia sediminis]|uniref:O-antigen/teichoic acid export membrane protein n=1 Tax=Pseudonocardia sediminis TaxID=1397368 RepID=A0A4Q7V0D0_PSEST|nr:O-antigen/teichoic acid export membrane protein [Pseudonocardia sediminis]
MRRWVPAGVSSSLRARAISLPVSAVAGVATSAMIINGRSPHVYGFAMLIGTIFLLLPFADLGLGASVVDAFAVGKSTDAVRVLAASLKALLYISAILVILAGGITVTVGWNRLLGIPIEFPEVDSVVLICIAIFATSLPFGLGQRLLLGLGKNHLAVWISCVSPIGTLLVAGVGLWAAFLPGLSVAVAFPTGLLIGSILAFAVGLRLVPISFAEVAKLTKNATLRDIKKLHRLALPMLVVTLSLPIAFQSDRFILAHQSTPHELALYALAAQLYNPMWAVASTAALPLWPTFRSRMLESIRATRSEWLRAIALFSGLSVLLGTALIVGGPLISDIVGSGQVQLSAPLMVVFALFLVVQCLHLPSGMFLMDAGGLRFQAVCVLVMLMVNLPLSWILAAPYGTAGPVMASIIAVFCCQLIPGIWRTRATLITAVNLGKS